MNKKESSKSPLHSFQEGDMLTLESVEDVKQNVSRLRQPPPLTAGGNTLTWLRSFQGFVRYRWTKEGKRSNKAKFLRCALSLKMSKNVTQDKGKTNKTGEGENDWYTWSPQTNPKNVYNIKTTNCNVTESKHQTKLSWEYYCTHSSNNDIQGTQASNQRVFCVMRINI